MYDFLVKLKRFICDIICKVIYFLHLIIFFWSRLSDEELVPVLTGRV